MSNEKAQWVEGMYPKPPHAKAQDFNIGKLSIDLERFMPWLREWCKANPGERWVNIEMNTNSKDPTKGNAKIDTWKPDPSKALQQAPEPQPEPQQAAYPLSDIDSDLPFSEEAA